MADQQAGFVETLDAPANDAVAVTPSDSVALTTTSRGLYIGAGGDVSVEMAGSGSAVLFVAVPTGAILPVRVTRVNATGTTASDIVALS